MEEPPRARSAMPTRPSMGQSRASRFFTKLSSFTNKSSRKTPGDTKRPYQTQARAPEAIPKPSMSQPSLALRQLDPYDPMGSDDSQPSTSPGPGSPRYSTQTPSQPPSNRPSVTFIPHSASVHRRSISTGLAGGATPSSTAAARPPDGLPSVSTEHFLTIDSNQGPKRHPEITQLIDRKTGAVPSASLTSYQTHLSHETSKPLPSLKPQQESSFPHRINNSNDVVPESRKHSMVSTASASPSGSQSGGLRQTPPPGTSTQGSASSAPTLRRAAPRLKSLPPAVFNRLTVDGARLSPSIMPRHTPMPILNLPVLPPPTPTIPQAVNPRARLSSMPALPHQGPTDRDGDPDHEDGTLEEMEEEDDDMYVDAPTNEGPSDDEDGDEQDGSTSGIIGRLRNRSRLPAVDTSRLDFSFIEPSRDAPGPSRFPLFPVKTPKDREPEPSSSNIGTSSDYFSSNYFSDTTGGDEPTFTSARTPRAVEVPLIPRQPRTPGQVMPLPTLDSARPTIYKQPSKSMIDLLSTKQDHRLFRDEDHKGVLGKGKGKARDLPEARSTLPPMETSTGSQLANATPAYDKLNHPLRRRRSMPTFNPATLPPPYPEFAPHPGGLGKNVVILPRDDEGRERLPPYSNSIYLKAIMPRKMEFSAPGVQAKDRKWRRVLCVLEGTSFKVYKCPPGASGVGVIGEWWEKKVGVGDVSVPLSPEALAAKAEAAKRRESRAAKLDTEVEAESLEVQVPNGDRSPQRPQSKEIKPKKGLASSFLKPSSAGSRTHSRSRSEVLSHPDPTTRPPSRPLSLGRPTSPVPSHNSSTGVSIAMSTASSSTSHSHFMSRLDAPELIVSEDTAELQQVYTLQNAESGLGNDYLKRKNVIRVRMQGEQFLLQAQNITGVVEWIEGFHAATNIALDLDERVMPKGPMFPRRRRRRPRPTDTVHPPNVSRRSSAT